MSEQARSKELLPCPFCGGTNAKVAPHSSGEWYVLCPTVGGCCIATGHSPSKEVVIAAWNRRTAHEPPAEDHARVWLIKERDEIKAAFKNFHRLLCERFGYCHDEKDWRRDQLSLIEHIAERATQPPPEEPSVMGAGCGVSPMPTVADAIKAHVRQIQQLCDAANLDPTEWLMPDLENDTPEGPSPTKGANDA